MRAKLLIFIMFFYPCKTTTAQSPIVQSSSTGISGGADNWLTMPKPPGLAVGDLMFAQCGANQCGFMTCSSPGWTSIIENNWPCGSSNTFLGCLYKIADAGDVAATDFTFTFSVGPQTNQGIIIRITGFDPANIISASAQGSAVSTANPSFNNSVTPLRANSLYLMSAADGIGNLITNPAIAISNPIWVTSLPRNSLRTLFYAPRPQATATGNSSFTAANSNWLCQMIIITPYCIPDGSVMNISACNSYTLNGVTYNSSGTYSQTLINSIGCDSIITLNLTIKPKSFSVINQSICEGQSYLGYNTSGTYIDTFIGINGCDSIRTLNLIVKPKSTLIINQSICEGQSYLGYNISGTYIDKFIGTNGCDSIRTLNLMVKPKSRLIINQSICEGQSYLGYSTSGIYIDTLTAANGCDSIRTLNLNVLENIKPNLGIDQGICTGDSLIISPGNFASYLWQDNSTLNHFNVKHSGVYSVVVSNLCGSKQDEIQITEKPCAGYFPNAFTPNNDSKNDFFKILDAFDLKNYQLTIYNRWGQKVFETQDYNQGWNGTTHNTPQSPGVYIYFCKYKKNGFAVATKGILMLIR